MSDRNETTRAGVERARSISEFVIATKEMREEIERLRAVYNALIERITEAGKYGHVSHWAGCPGTDVRTDRDGTYCGLCGNVTTTTPVDLAVHRNEDRASAEHATPGPLEAVKEPRMSNDTHVSYAPVKTVEA